MPETCKNKKSNVPTFETSESTGLGNFIKDFLLLLPRDHGVQRKDSKPGANLGLSPLSRQKFPQAFLLAQLPWNCKKVKPTSHKTEIIVSKNDSSSTAACNKPGEFLLFEMTNLALGYHPTIPQSRVTVLFRAEKCCISHIFSLPKCPKMGDNP